MMEEKSVFETNFTEDDSIPMEDILSGIRKSQNAKAQELKHDNTVEQKKEEPNVQKELSPLEKLQQAQKEGKNNPGLIVSNQELKDGEDGPKKSFAVNDTRINSINESLKEADELLDKRKKVVLVKEPENEAEYAQMMNEIDSLKKTADGQWFFDLHADILDPDSRLVRPKFVRLREKGEPEFDLPGKPMKSTNDNTSESNTQPTDSADKEKTQSSTEEESSHQDMSPEKQKMVEILIDKTGLGTNINFTDDERKKIQEADTIKINEIKKIDINTIRIARPKSSFQNAINQYDYSGSRITMAFPGSGFKADIKGLTYGEYSDIATSVDNSDFDKVRKRLSVIYNKLTNISTGPFKDFDDFLKHFAYNDITLALYGLYIASDSELEEMTLQCNNDTCKKTFKKSFNTRSLLKLDKCGNTLLKKWTEIVSAPSERYQEIQENASVNVSNIIELPDSKYLLDLGMISAYDYLHNIVPLLNEDTFNETFGEDEADTMYQIMFFLLAIRSVYVPNKDGGYDQYFGYKDIINIIYTISPRESNILTSYLGKLNDEYNYSFELTGVECPYCHTKSDSVDVDVNNLLFQTYQRLVNTRIDLTNTQEI